ncbi:MAG: hypothetical protein PHW69_07870 [Elusimicrobiaceae bacterium]|nr:hypothetical protein [Elusimicrobiaceae bacterium]
MRIKTLAVLSIGLMFLAAAVPAHAKRKKYDIPPWDENVSEYKANSDTGRSGYVFNSKHEVITEDMRKADEKAQAELEKKCKKKKTGDCGPARKNSAAFVFEKTAGTAAYKFDEDGDIVVSTEAVSYEGGETGAAGSRPRLADWRKGKQSGNSAAGAAGAAGGGAAGLGGMAGLLGGKDGGDAGAMMNNIMKNAGGGSGGSGGAGGIDVQQLMKQMPAGAMQGGAGK